MNEEEEEGLELSQFWKKQLKDIKEMEQCNHLLPLTRIRRIMKSDEDVAVGTSI